MTVTPPSILRLLRRRPLAALGLTVLTLLALGALGANWLAPYDPMVLRLEDQLAGPSQEHLLGCDENGRDVLTLLLYGARVSLTVGLSSMALSLGVGAALGALAGYRGGWLDEVLMRVVDVCLAFPGVLLAILIIFLTQRPSVVSVVLALSITGWASYARLTRGEVLRERELDYVQAALALGLSRSRILFRHVLPNVTAPLIVQATFGVAGAILSESALAFLGLGPTVSAFWGMSWGALLDQGASYFLLTPHLALFPGAVIMLTVLSINFVGDALRDEWDPHRRSERAEHG